MALTYLLSDITSIDPLCKVELRLTNGYKIYKGVPPITTPFDTRIKCCECFQGDILTCMNCRPCLFPVRPAGTGS